MQGICSTCVKQNTIDEAPMAYKPIAEIEKYLDQTIEVQDRIIPVYNFKAF